MSYILDALRKSEQERHRDQLPQEARTRLMMPVKAPQPTGLKTVLVSILVLNVFAVIGGALYLYFSREQAPAAGPPFATTPSPASPSAGEPAGSGLPDPRSIDAAPEELLRREGRPLPQRVMPPSSLNDYGDYHQEPDSILPDVGYINRPAMTQPGTDYSSDYGPASDYGSVYHPEPEASTGEHLSDKLDARLERLRPREVLKPLPSAPVQTTTSSRSTMTLADEEGMELIRPSSIRGAQMPMPEAPARPVMAPAAMPAPAEPAAPAAADINTLPQEFQQSLPALTFNSHIYSSDPGNRRIMINNQYLREGQKFGDMRVREITPEGVVLFKEPYTFHVLVIRDWKP